MAAVALSVHPSCAALVSSASLEDQSHQSKMLRGRLGIPSYELMNIHYDSPNNLDVEEAT